MKKRLSILTLASCLFLGGSMAQAQSGLQKSNREYDNWAYVDAIKIYENLLKKGYVSQEVLEKLGNAYYFNANYAEANKHYERLFNEYGDALISNVYYYRYANTLQNVGDEIKAKRFYDQFVAKVGSQSQISKIRSQEEILKQKIQENSGRYSDVLNLPINSKYADYGSFVHDKTLYFTSARDTGNFSKKEHTWTGASFTSLYKYNLDESAKKNKVSRVKGKVTSHLNESSAVVTKDGNTMYFTRNNIINGKRGYDADRNTKLKIYRSTLVNGKWSKPEELSINSNDFNTAHPALNKEENVLYFSSDRPGGFGESDLWKVAILKDGKLGNPQNLGDKINTEARETFPFLTETDELYFSSNGRVGLGNLDVYAVKMDENGEFGEVHNVGMPINSADDDFAYYIDVNTKKGFFSSNRQNGNGGDDIYSFVEDKPLVFVQEVCKQELLVTVFDAKTKQKITDATLNLADALYTTIPSKYEYTSEGYKFDAEINCGETYRIKASKEGYETSEKEVVISDKTGVTVVEVPLNKVKIEVKKGDDLFKVLKLNPIYFDLDKDNIRPDAAVELAKILAVMEEYPTMKIDVRSHTDSRGSTAYNDKLSGRRAKSTAEWLIANGIDRSRITYKGYGERQLLNECKDGVKCSEEKHQENRRSEFIIISM